MEFLLDNPLATMEGTYFLILYAFVIFFTVTTLGYFKDRIDTSDRLSIPATPPWSTPLRPPISNGKTKIFWRRQTRRVGDT